MQVICAKRYFRGDPNGGDIVTSHRHRLATGTGCAMSRFVLDTHTPVRITRDLRCADTYGSVNVAVSEPGASEWVTFAERWNGSSWSAT